MSKIHQETGLTFGQIIAVCGLVALILSNWISQTNKTTENTARIVALEIGYNRIEANQMEIMKDNKADHVALGIKIDKTNTLIMQYLTNTH